MARDYGIAAAFDAGHHWAPHAGPGGGNHQSQPGELENAETSGVRPCPKQLRCRVECCNKVKYEGETKNNLQVRMQMVEGNPMVSAEAVQTTPKQMAKPVWKQKCQLPVPDELNCGRTLSVRKGWVHERRHAPPASPWTADNRLPVMAPSPRSPSKMLSPRHQRISDEALCLQMQQFLDNWHYIVMKSSLGKTMDRRKVLEMALHVLSMNGIRFSAEEINELVQTEETGTTSSAWHNGDWMRHSQEEVMIYEVVDRMPEGLRDGFEHLTLELLVVVTTAARMRTWILWNPVASNVVNSMINHPIEQP
eukprot:s275_g32.t1